MSTNSVIKPSQPLAGKPSATTDSGFSVLLQVVVLILKSFASLKLTVTLFALGIVIILVGTLAQTTMNMWDVRAEYFHAWVSWVPFQVFFPAAWFPSLQNVPFGFYFPGGKTIGVLMTINLLAAHLVRFKIQTNGGRLAGGLAFVSVGALVTWLVIASGHNADGMQAVPVFEWVQLWQFFKIGVTLVWLAAIGLAIHFGLRGGYRSVAFWVITSVPLLFSSPVVIWMLIAGSDAYLGDAGMRILWQLMQATFAAVILLCGCWLVFKKRAGIVLLHAGIGLIMFGEFLVDLYAVESRVSLFENETTTYAEDSRITELAIIDKSSPKFDEETTIPEWMLRDDETIRDPRLPFDVVPVTFLENSQFSTRRDQFGQSGPAPLSLSDVGADFKNPATAGAGLFYAGVATDKASGTDMNQTDDYQSAYVTLVRRSTADGGSDADDDGAAEDDDEDVIGTYLVSRLLNDQKIDVDGKTYHVALRHKRIYKPFTIRLNDVRKDDYVGTNTPRHYASDIQLVDPEKGINRSINIWMNNPLRYAGETYYQSGYNMIGGREMTTLAVVTNSGWMIPYVGCMLVAVGLLAHFSFTLMRFLGRQATPQTTPQTTTGAVDAILIDDQPSAGSLKIGAGGRQEPRVALLILPVAFVAIGILWVTATALPRRDKGDDAAQVNRFNRLPIAYQGRVKPFDTLALNSLRIISEKASFQDVDKTSQSASRWLTDVLAHTDGSMDHRVFRVENLDVLHTFGLKRRKGFRYAYNELAPELDEFKKQVRQARGQDRKTLSTYQKKLLELDSKIELFLALRESHRVPERDFPAAEWADRLASMTSFAATLADSKAPRAVPGTTEQRTWEPLTTALTANWIREIAAEKEIQTTDALAQLLTDTLLDEEEVQRLIEQQIVTMIESIVRSRNPDMKAAEAREFARSTAAALPPHMRDVILPAAQREVEQRRTMLLANLSSLLQKVNGGTKLDVPQNELANSMGAALVAYRAGNAADAKWKAADSKWREAGRKGDEADRKQYAADRERYAADREQYASEFNSQLQQYETLLADADLDDLTLTDNLANRSIAGLYGSFYEFEAYYNGLGPSDTSGWLYLLAFVLSVLGLLVWRRTLNRTAFALIVFTFILHTFAIYGRIYISGRPPITNLYSSAVFIGWGCVLLAIMLELIFRTGICNIAAAVIGFLTLRVAYALAGDGDTFVVLQAVLDTQFWLATHVVCISFGYATTFLAGGLAIIYILIYVARSIMAPDFSESELKDLSRMIYGVLCFAIFFSFVGTVLGGLWADDSWGRFWGWDPKENGALMIVLWIALVLHARWSGIVKQRGMAVLAVVGNMVTAWSWFGVNELGVGLHSYGFTEGVLNTLVWFWLSQFLVVVAGCLPWQTWFGQRKQPPTATVGS